MKKKIVLLFCIVVGGYAQANDTIARVGTGGITFLKTDDIRMVSEVLEISMNNIKVSYEFYNGTNQDLKTSIAFPMPLYKWTSGVSAGDVNIGSLKTFKLLVNDILIPAQSHRVALIGERDVTSELRNIGLSDIQIFESFGDCTIDLCNLTQEQKMKIAQLDKKEFAFPPWEVSETAWWEQVFPAKKTIKIVHEYKPFVGMRYSVPYQERHGFIKHPSRDDFLQLPYVNSEKEDRTVACVDDKFLGAVNTIVKSRVKKGISEVSVYLDDIEYVLGTGRNWKGAIASFKLKIMKDSPDQLISVCFPGKPERVGNAIEFSHTNFVPQDKLVVYFYTVSTNN